MDKFGKERTDLDIARRQESKAYNEMAFRSQQAKEQKSQLEALLEYKNECLDGLANARESGLTPAHVREYQLLMKHISSIVEVVEYKVNTSQDNLDKAQQTWQQKNEYFEKVKEASKKETPRLDDIIYEDEEETAKKPDGIEKKYYGHLG